MDLHATSVTKSDAANRQLSQAIRLFFRGGDLLSVHTLTGAAFQLYSDLGKTLGIVSRFRSEELIRPERMKDWVNALNSTQNFLKHADRDAGEVHNFVEEGTFLFLYETVELATRIDSRRIDERLWFQLWFAATYHDLIDPTFLAKLNAANPGRVDTTDRTLWAALLSEA